MACLHALNARLHALSNLCCYRNAAHADLLHVIVLTMTAMENSMKSFAMELVSFCWKIMSLNLWPEICLPSTGI